MRSRTFTTTLTAAALLLAACGTDADLAAEAEAAVTAPDTPDVASDDEDAGDTDDQSDGRQAAIDLFDTIVANDRTGAPDDVGEPLSFALPYDARQALAPGILTEGPTVPIPGGNDVYVDDIQLTHDGRNSWWIVGGALATEYQVEVGDGGRFDDAQGVSNVIEVFNLNDRSRTVVTVPNDDEFQANEFDTFFAVSVIAGSDDGGTLLAYTGFSTMRFVDVATGEWSDLVDAPADEGALTRAWITDSGIAVADYGAGAVAYDVASGAILWNEPYPGGSGSLSRLEDDRALIVRFGGSSSVVNIADFSTVATYNGEVETGDHGAYVKERAEAGTVIHDLDRDDSITVQDANRVHPTDDPTRTIVQFGSNKDSSFDLLDLTVPDTLWSITLPENDGLGETLVAVSPEGVAIGTVRDGATIMYVYPAA